MPSIEGGFRERGLVSFLEKGKKKGKVTLIIVWPREASKKKKGGGGGLVD